MSLSAVILLSMMAASLFALSYVVISLKFKMAVMQAKFEGRAEGRAEIIKQIERVGTVEERLAVQDPYTAAYASIARSIDRTEEIHRDIKETCEYIRRTCDHIETMLDEMVETFRAIRVFLEDEMMRRRMALPVHPSRLLAAGEPEFAQHIDIEFKRLSE